MHSMKVKHSKLKKETLKALPEPDQDHYQNTLPQTGTVAGVAKHLDMYIYVYTIILDIIKGVGFHSISE